MSITLSRLTQRRLKHRLKSPEGSFKITTTLFSPDEGPVRGSIWYNAETGDQELLHVEEVHGKLEFDPSSTKMKKSPDPFWLGPKRQRFVVDFKHGKKMPLLEFVTKVMAGQLVLVGLEMLSRPSETHYC